MIPRTVSIFDLERVDAPPLRWKYHYGARHGRSLVSECGRFRILRQAYKQGRARQRFLLISRDYPHQPNVTMTFMRQRDAKRVAAYLCATVPGTSANADTLLAHQAFAKSSKVED